MNIAIIDLVFLGIILWFVIVATIKGLIAEVFGKAAFVVGILIGLLFANDLYPSVVIWVPIPFVAQILSFILIFIAVFLAIKILQLLLGSLFSGEVLGSLNRALGFFFGLAEGLIIVSFVLIILHLQPWFDVSSLLDNSIFDVFLGNFISYPIEIVNQRIDV